MFRPLGAALVLTIASGASASRGAPAGKLAVVDVSTPPAMLGLGQEITQALLQEAKAQGLQVLTPDDILATLGPKPYDELQACGGRAECVARKLEPLGAERAVVGALSRDEKNYLVHLWLIDVRAHEVITDVDRAILIASRRLMADVKGAAPDLLRGKKEARGTLKLSANVKSATATIDGEPAGKTPLEVSLKPGKHEVKLEKKSYLPITRLVTVEPNAATEEVLRLTLAPGEKPEEEELPELVAGGAPTQPQGFHVPATAWVAVGAGAVAFGTGAAFGWSASHAAQQLQAGYDPQTQIYSGTRARALAGKQDAVVANVCYGVAAAGLAAAAVLTWLGQSDSVQVTPTAGPSGAGMALVGHF